MPPRIITLGKTPLAGKDREAFEEAVRRANGKVHVLVHPGSMDARVDVMFRRVQEHTPDVIAPVGQRTLLKTYDRIDFLKAFADRYHMGIHDIMAADEPKIVLVEKTRTPGGIWRIKRRIKRGWMSRLSKFDIYMDPANRRLIKQRDSNSVIIIVPTPKAHYEPLHGWEPLEETLAGVDVRKNLEVSGIFMAVNPSNGRMLEGCLNSVFDRLRLRRGNIKASSVSINRSAVFPDVEGLTHTGHTFLDAPMRRRGVTLAPHNPFSDGVISKLVRRMLVKEGPRGKRSGGGQRPPRRRSKRRKKRR